MKKYIKYILLLGFLGGAFGFYMYNKPHKNMSKAKADIELSASQLFTDFENNEADANTKYLDKIIEVEGIVKEITKDEKGMTSITLEGGSEMFGVICQMDDLAKHKRTDFKEGESVKFKGICTGVLMDVILVRCVEV
jgi:putative nucleic acid binding protein